MHLSLYDICVSVSVTVTVTRFSLQCGCAYTVEGGSAVEVRDEAWRGVARRGLSALRSCADW